MRAVADLGLLALLGGSSLALVSSGTATVAQLGGVLIASVAPWLLWLQRWPAASRSCFRGQRRFLWGGRPSGSVGLQSTFWLSGAALIWALLSGPPKGHLRPIRPDIRQALAQSSALRLMRLRDFVAPETWPTVSDVGQALARAIAGIPSNITQMPREVRVRHLSALEQALRPWLADALAGQEDGVTSALDAHIFSSIRVPPQPLGRPRAP